MFGKPVQEPESLQVAVAFPDGTYEDNYPTREDNSPGRNWHIDGHGEMPPFALLVGCNLIDNPSNVRSWGGFTVFPGTHVDSGLHDSHFNRAVKGGPRQDLGTGVQLR